MSHQPLKLVLAGPMGAGKTTTIRSLTDHPPVSTEVPIAGGGIDGKTTTTVAMDFSPITLKGEAPLLVYGLPGQKRFDFMRRIILRDAFGTILLLKADSDSLKADLDDWLESIVEAGGASSTVVGITHADKAPKFSLGDVRNTLRRHDMDSPSFTFDARDKEQCENLVRAMLLSMGAMHAA